jgi:hypothetical protein
MIRISQVVLCAAFVSGFAAPSYATCSLPGKWHTVTIAAGTNNQPGSATLVAGCRITIKATGNLTGTCIDQALGQSAPSSTNVSGTLKTNAKCEMSGVWKAAGSPDAAVLAGFASGDSATFTAVRGSPAFQVRSVSMMRD